MANKKKMPAKKKPMSLRERMKNRTRMIDEASGFGEKKPVKKGADRKTPIPKKYQ